MVEKRWLAGRRRIVMIGLLVMIIGISLYVVMEHWSKREGKAGVIELLMIDHVSVPQEEFQWFLQDEKAETVNYFYQQYGAEYTDKFWTAMYGEEIPIEVAKARALDRLLKIKVEQALAVDYRLLKSSHITAIKAAMNKSEQSKYGATNLQPFQQYMLFHQRLVLEVKQQFKKEAPAMTEDKLLAFYDENKTQLFTLPDELFVKQISWISSDLEEEKTAVEQLILELQSGQEVEQLLHNYSKLKALQIEDKRFGTDESKDENASTMEMSLKEVAYSLEQGVISEALSLGNRQYVLYSVERNAGNIIDFSEVRLWIEDVLYEEQYEQLIEEEAKKAAITFNEVDWDRLQVY